MKITLFTAFQGFAFCICNNHAKNCNWAVVKHSNRSETAKGNFYNNSVKIMIIMLHNKTYRTRYRDVLN